MIPYWALLLLTIGLELGVVVLVRLWRPSLRSLPLLSTCACLNLLTHPLASAAYTMLGASILLLELVVIAAESIGYRVVAGASWKMAISISLAANFVSGLAGLLV